MVPSLFLAHGSPMMATQENDYTKFLMKLGETIKPKAIAIFTAHWDTEMLTVSSSDNVYDTIYDFYGFPKELYEIKYNAKGSSSVAEEIVNRFKSKGIKVQKDVTRGLDHGAWTLLMHLYPNADIPVIQISVNSNLPIKEQINIGNALKGLGDEDILVIGSGNTVHNLRMVNWQKHTTDPWAEEFDNWLIEKVQNKDMESLYNYRTLSPNADLAVPTAEHFVPLFLAFGSSKSPEVKVIYRKYDLGNLSYLCFQI